MPSKSQWHDLTAQKLVRYEALFNLIDDIQMVEDIALISKRVTRQWKYFANVAAWHLVVIKNDGFLVIDGFRGDAEVMETAELSPWDSYHYRLQHPRLLKLSDPWENPLPPEHLTEKFVTEIAVQQFMLMDQCIGLLSTAARHEPFNELDKRFIRIFGSHLADRILGILLRRASIEALVTRATKDGLTGLLNRTTIFEQLVSRHELSMRTGQPLSIILADLDYFKVINDSYGHLCGDHVLKEVSRRLQLQTRAGDQLGRYGGEEFLAILYPCSTEQALIAAERFRLAIADKPFTINGDTSSQIEITISLGTSSTFGQPSVRMEELLKQADEALYKSKAKGRNCMTAAWDMLLSE